MISFLFERHAVIPEQSRSMPMDPRFRGIAKRSNRRARNIRKMTILLSFRQLACPL